MSVFNPWQSVAGISPAQIRAVLHGCARSRSAASRARCPGTQQDAAPTYGRAIRFIHRTVTLHCRRVPRAANVLVLRRHRDLLGGPRRLVMARVMQHCFLLLLSLHNCSQSHMKRQGSVHRDRSLWHRKTLSSSTIRSCERTTNGHACHGGAAAVAPYQGFQTPP